MKVLVVASGNSEKISPLIKDQIFVEDQIKALSEKGIEIDRFLINGLGIKGYLKNRKPLIQKIIEFNPDLIHAHYGLSGLLANLQRKKHVITTYHGSDINNIIPFILSLISIFLSKYNIFVTNKLALKARVNKKYSIISCGVNLNTFKVLDKTEPRKKMGMSLGKYYILFSAAFSNKVKNYPLAAEAIKQLKSRGYDIELVEFIGYDRDETSTLMNAVDCVLVTSFKESGPLVIKEAMAVNTPAVSVDVGDVNEIMNSLDGYYLASYSPKDIADKIQSALAFGKRTNGRKRIIELGLDSETVTNKILEVYKKVQKTDN